MNFKFKLSKRLAMLKASLVASAALALACDRTDPSAPEAVPHPLMQVATPLPATSVVASAHDGNVPQNTLDNNLATRWASYGDGQWIRYDLGALRSVGRVDIAWYRGNEWASAFDIEVSPDAVTWTKVFGGRSSGQTLQPERYDFPVVTGRYVRITAHGQWSGTTRLSLWNSITEVATYDASAPVRAVLASADDGNVPQNTLDNNLATRWAAYGDGQWIRYDLGSVVAIDRVDIAWHLGDARKAIFDIEVSPDAVTWTKVFSGRSSGLTLKPEPYAFPAASGQYVRIVGHGNSLLTGWNTITEVDVYSAPAPPPPPVTALAATSVVASGDDGNVPSNTLDNSLATRWAAYGDGQWIRYDLGAVASIPRVDIAWHRGNEWSSAFDLDVSPDGVTWTRVLAGRSSGQTLQPERYDFSTVTGRYVRITGHGQWSGTALLSLWSSVTEVDIYGTPAVTVNPVPVASLTVSPAPASVSAGAVQQLSAVVKDANGNVLTGRAVTWATTSSAVATVSSGGLVTGVAPGSGSITATCEGQSAAAAITVTSAELAVGSVIASGDDGNVPPNTLDNSLATRWSANGDGQWIKYDLGAVASIPRVDIAWHRGNEWASAFDLDVSPDGVTWTRVFAGRSSGQTLQPERYDFATVTGRYVRITGHGQWSGTAQLSLWTSITEVDIHGSGAVTVDLLPVASVTVSPASAGVSAGATQQLSAVVRDANGNLLLGRSVTWASSAPAVATVSSSGLVTGVATGTASITATSEGRSGTAAITVASASGGGGGPEPGPTATIIFQDGFESGNLSLWTQEPYTGRYSVSTNAARVRSGTRSMEALYTPTNTYGFIARWFMPGYDEVYVKFYVMFEEGFENPGMHYFAVCGNRIDNSKSCLGTAGRVPNGTDHFYAGIDPEYNPSNPILYPLHYYTYWPDMSCCYGNRSYQTSPKTPLSGGRWQEVVYHIKLNTPGQYNGSHTLWIDGVKKIDVQNMRWRNTTDLTINQIMFPNYMGSGPSKTEHVWVDDVTVWRP